VAVARNRRTHLRGAADAGVFCPERHHLGLVLRLRLRQPQLVRPLLLGHRGGVRALLVREQRRPLLLVRERLPTPAPCAANTTTASASHSHSARVVQRAATTPAGASREAVRAFCGAEALA
jgi:hypothetical protein